MLKKINNHVDTKKQGPNTNKKYNVIVFVSLLNLVCRLKQKISQTKKTLTELNKVDKLCI